MLQEGELTIDGKAIEAVMEEVEEVTVLTEDEEDKEEASEPAQSKQDPPLPFLPLFMDEEQELEPPAAKHIKLEVERPLEALE